ncbi:MAG: hypothetical protein ACRCS9_13585 [Hyphomicrobium sp.]
MARAFDISNDGTRDYRALAADTTTLTGAQFAAPWDGWERV